MENAGLLLPIPDTKAHLELSRKALDRDSQLTAPGPSIPGEPMAGRAEKAGTRGMSRRDQELRF
jgi:hypothetical protein